MADVFISYSKGTADNIVQQIADALNGAGISCWYMGRDSRHGRYPGKITKAIRECSIFALILNQDSNQSKNVLSEVNIAFKYDREILPFHIDDCEMSDALFYHLSPFTTINANPPNKQRIQELVKEIADILGREPLQSPPTPSPKLQPQSAKIIKNGECGLRVTYTLDENGVLMISGQGLIRNFEWDEETKTYNTPWWDRRRTISHVEIGNGVTAIGTGAFYDCICLTSVTIPDSTTYIGNLSFHGCNGLINVSIPDNVTYVGNAAFFGCTGLISVNIPDSVTHIGEAAFCGCTGLTDVHISNNVIRLERGVFLGCSDLKSINIPKNVSRIGDWAFQDCTGLTSVSISDGVTEIGNASFKNCARLKTINIPDSVIKIGYLTFKNCTQLVSASIPAKAKLDFGVFPVTTHVIHRA